jgi:hypothetical protein
MFLHRHRECAVSLKEILEISSRSLEYQSLAFVPEMSRLSFFGGSRCNSTFDWYYFWGWLHIHKPRAENQNSFRWIVSGSPFLYGFLGAIRVQLGKKQWTLWTQWTKRCPFWLSPWTGWTQWTLGDTMDNFRSSLTQKRSQAVRPGREAKRDESPVPPTKKPP